MSIFYEDIYALPSELFLLDLCDYKLVLIPQGQMKILDAIYLQAALVTLSFESFKEVLNYELSLSVATRVYDYCWIA